MAIKRKPSYSNFRVGKTSLIKRYVQNKYIPAYKPTIGADFLTKEVLVDQQVVTLQCWDTAGQEKYHSLTAAFYKGANCCVLVYDITEPGSFKSLNDWKDRFLANAALKNPDTFPFVLIGNKSDLEDKRKVKKEIAEKWCQDNLNIPYYEASAISGDLNYIFKKVTEVALANHNGVM